MRGKRYCGLTPFCETVFWNGHPITVDAVMRVYQDLFTRMGLKAATPEGCVEWDGRIQKHTGFPTAKLAGGTIPVRTVLMFPEFHFNPDEACRWDFLPACGNSKCVNPAHFRPRIKYATTMRGVPGTVVRDLTVPVRALLTQIRESAASVTSEHLNVRLALPHPFLEELENALKTAERAYACGEFGPVSAILGLSKD